ncbi:scaffold/adaptor protein [Lithospermum erythrorhizon]|uniref:Scaffold/adaptor protein n=1 Tax=Lithospermum erythrorhizon TaxID=34254 RepID=A0AAV3PAI0_LITER
MACRGFFECLLKLMNALLTIMGLAMVGYGIFLFVEYKDSNSPGDDPAFPPSSEGILQLGRPMMIAVSFGSNIFDNLPKAWFIYLFIGLGALIVLIACCGCISTATRNGCCLSCYSLLVILLILGELACASYVFFNEDWKDEIPMDKTGNFSLIYHFLEDHWDIVKWVCLGVVILEALVFFLALAVRSANSPAEYDSDDEYILPRQQIRQPLINNPPAPASGVPVAGVPDSRQSRSDAWSARMREKYGLDTSEFTYNPSGSNRYPQNAAQPAEEKSRCIIM